MSIPHEHSHCAEHTHEEVHVHTDEDGHGHDHAHEDAHVHTHEDGHGHDHAHEDAHTHDPHHEDGHMHAHRHGHHAHTSVASILEKISSLDLSDIVKNMQKAFTALSQPQRVPFIVPIWSRSTSMKLVLWMR